MRLPTAVGLNPWSISLGRDFCRYRWSIRDDGRSLDIRTGTAAVFIIEVLRKRRVVTNC